MGDNRGPWETMGDHAQTTDLGLGRVRPRLGDHGRPWETMAKLRILDLEVHAPA